MKGLKFFGRTSDRQTINLASWHSPHSLTWSWIISLSWGGFQSAFSKPVFTMRWEPHFGFALMLGFPRLLLLWTYRHNGGRQWSATFLGADFNWLRQQPMWFRDMWQREQVAKQEAARQRNLMRQFAGPRP